MRISTLRPPMPPRALTSCSQTFRVVAMALPMMLGGPLSGMTAPRTSLSFVTPGSAASALPKASVASALRQRRWVSFCGARIAGLLWNKQRVCAAGSESEGPMGPVMLDVAPSSHQAIGLKTQEQNDREPINDAFDLIGGSGARPAEAGADHAEYEAQALIEQDDESRAEQGSGHRTQATHDEHGERLDRDQQAEAVHVQVACVVG